MEEMSIHSVEHIEHIVTIKDSNVHNEKMATFTEVVKDQTSNKNNTDVSDSSQ
jgi:hypothetical protein